ncbi:MAG: hypothetical protein AAF696_14095 [Bacteroidota bacterium]
MKRIIIALMLLLFLGMSSILFAQESLIHLRELSNSGKKPRAIPQEGLAVVDINSSIELLLEVDKIENELFKLQGLSGDDSRLLQLENLNRLLKAEIEITKHINKGFQNNPEAELAYFQTLYNQKRKLLLSIRADRELYLDLISPQSDAASNKFEGNYAEFILYFLNQKADSIRKDILSSMGLSEDNPDSQVYFRLGAFLRDKDGGRPIHVENFDEYDKENYQEIARFSQSISEDEKAELRENAKLNEQLGSGIKENINYYKRSIKAYSKNLFGFSQKYKKLDTTYNQTLKSLRSDEKTLPAALVLLENPLEMNLVESAYKSLSSQFDDIMSLFSPELAKQERIDLGLDKLEQVILTAYSSFNQNVQAYRQDPQKEKWGKDQLGVVQEEYKEYVDTAQENISQIRKFFQNFRNAIRPFRKVYLENESFTEKVSRFKVGEIPQRGLIELSFIGARNPGDQILIKATMERGTGNSSFQQKQVYRRVLKIQRIEAHIKMSGSIIMANPYNRENNANIDLENRFQFTPTYGIILKWGSRKSNFYNNFVNLGLGLAFSSPDFNTDGTPEFGAGVMVTGFRDILSAGWGWNFGMDAPYSFIGFNIPFSIGGLPNGNNVRPNN